MTWSDISSALRTDVGIEVLADAPGFIHKEAKAVGVADPHSSVPTIISPFWSRYSSLVLVVIGLGLVWFFFFRK